MRKRFNKVLTLEFLKKEYLDNKKSCHNIASKVSCSQENILYYLKKFNIKRRYKNYKHGLTMIKKYCNICSKKLNKIATLKNTINCTSCSKKIAFLNPENHPSWKGGITPLHKSIRNLDEYKIWRIVVLKRYNYKCILCNSTKRLETDHIKSFAVIFKEFLSLYDQFSPHEDKETLVRLAIKYKPFWNINNGQILCKKCHNEKTRVVNDKRI